MFPLASCFLWFKDVIDFFFKLFILPNILSSSVSLHLCRVARKEQIDAVGIPSKDLTSGEADLRSR